MLENEMHTGFVTIIGRPNVGKSTLMNRLIGQKIAITSPRPQTTRNRIRTIYTDERGQIIFVDTPGIHRAKNKLGEYMVDTALKSISGVDLVLYMIEPFAQINKNDEGILEQLKAIEGRTPIILVINKADTKKREDILPVIDSYRKQMEFAEVISISAIEGDRTDELMELIYKYLPEGEPLYDEDAITDLNERDIVSDIIREKALRLMSEEIPHGIAVSIDSMKVKGANRVMHIDATITAEKESHKGMLIGKGGEMLKRIGSDARRDIEELVGRKVNLKLFVRVRKNWRNNDLMVKDFGYSE